MHWLDCVHAPARVRVVWSKIWIALLATVMVELAVAVKIAFAPGCRYVAPAARSRRWADWVGRSVATGTLGAIAGGAIESPVLTEPGAVVVVRSTSVHAAGLLGAGLALPAGHGDWPSGVEATPGAILVSTRVSQAA